MKAAVYYSLDDVRVEELPKPKIGPDEVLVEMKACGVCGSDLMDWYLKKRAPLVLGHEPAGIVVEVGAKVRKYQLGDRVFVHHHVACLTCHYCIHGDYTLCEKFHQTRIEPGGFAQYFRVPAPNLQVDTLKIPDELSFEEATLIEPVACCIRALNKCRVQPGDTVAVIGAGPAGIIHTVLSKRMGASRVFVVDFFDYRLSFAEKFGADLAVNPQRESFVDKVKEATDDRGVDLVVVTAPNVQAYSAGMEVCRKGGTICVFAPTSPEKSLAVSPHKLFFNEIKLVPSYSTSHLETRMALELIRSGIINAKKLITHRFHLTRTTEAFKIAAKSKECLKVVILNE